MDDKYKPGWKSVWSIYPKENIGRNIWRPLVLLAIAVISSFFSSKSSTELISVVSNWITSGYPSIIGFILSGYVLIVGFSGSDFLLNLAKPNDAKYTLFQVLNSTFAVVIAVMIITYAIGALLSFIVSCEIEWPFPTNCGCDAFNFIALVFIEFTFFYSLNTLLDVVINIFNMGQMANVIAEHKIKAIENAEKDVHEETCHLFCKFIKNLFGL